VHDQYPPRRKLDRVITLFEPHISGARLTNLVATQGKRAGATDLRVACSMR